MLQAQPDLMTTDEVAELFRVAPATVRYWRHIGTGPTGFRVGRGVRYAREDVEKHLNDLRAAARTDAA